MIEALQTLAKTMGTGTAVFVVVVAVLVTILSAWSLDTARKLKEKKEDQIDDSNLHNYSALMLALSLVLVLVSAFIVYSKVAGDKSSVASGGFRLRF